VSHDRLHARGAQLTAREKEVLRTMVDGGSNDEIADTLCISPGTVRTHVTHILSKLNLTRRTQAVAYAIKHRMADIDDA
jgi:NarL family two-component system response regulator LiaR